MIHYLIKKSLYFNSYSSSKAFNCKILSEQILQLTHQKIQKLQNPPKVSILMGLDQNEKPIENSKIYVNKKQLSFNSVGIKSDLHFITSTMNQTDIIGLITKLNSEDSVTGIMVQLPFPSNLGHINMTKVLNSIDIKKNIDGLYYTQKLQPDLKNPEYMKPATPLGILTLITSHGIETEGKLIVVIGKGSLVGIPLTNLLKSYPFNATVINCDIYTKNIEEITKMADIVISACGKAQFLHEESIKERAILIDVGVNVVITEKTQKKKIVGDFSKNAYQKSSFYTPVPGGVGLLTVSSLAFNVYKAYLSQQECQIPELYEELRFSMKDFRNDHRHHYLEKEKEFQTNEKKLHLENQDEKNHKNMKVMLLSSSFNGLTQRVQRSLTCLGYTVSFAAATSADAMREAVKINQPNIIICPTLMKAIPKDIYQNIKCLIVHPGIKGDRGPSSIDWAILNDSAEWGVTLVEAHDEMDAGDIWGTEVFPLKEKKTKVQIYNKLVCQTAERLIIQALKDFENKNFTPEKLDYSNPSVKGNLHRSIKLTDPERSIDWNNDTIQQIIKKSRAAETQPGLKVELALGGQIMKRFAYGLIEEKQFRRPSHLAPGEIFKQRYGAICVATKDSSVWIKQMRPLKSQEIKHPFKVPSIFSINPSLARTLEESEMDLVISPTKETFQEIAFEKKGEKGILYFQFYNGAMSTQQCERLEQAITTISKMPDIKALILVGSTRSWSNGVHLNVIQNSSNPAEESWKNIIAINRIAKAILKIKDKITIAAMQANAGAGGVYLSLACDYVFAKPGIVLNPHYKNMGLYGSELHTYTGPLKIGLKLLNELKEKAQPLIIREAAAIGLIDNVLLHAKSESTKGDFFLDHVKRFTKKIISDSSSWQDHLLRKNQKLNASLRYKSLEDYEKEELEQMQKDFYENRNSYHEKRKAFVWKVTDAQVVAKK